jgi:23S rRNA pseudouridine1911/1915/1917 synthase
MTGGTRFQVVFEDRHLIVVDKAPGVLTVPTPQGERNTLVDLLERYFQHQRPGARPPSPRNSRDRRPLSERHGRDRRSARGRFAEVVHRLDRETSGLLVFAKNPDIRDALREQFHARAVERIYLAIVTGRVKEDAGTFSSYLTTNKALGRYSTRDEERGELAVTYFRVRSRGTDATFVEAQLQTGRRNQIRVHFAEAGHPVLGDPRYGSRRAIHPQWPASRLALHACVLGLVHPGTGEPVRWESPLPAVFRTFASKQGWHPEREVR